MIKIPRANKFKVYLFFIVIISVLTTNMVLIISPNWGIFLKIFLISILVFSLIHLVYYKFYWYLIRYKNEERISKGLLNSSIVGGILLSLISIFNLIYTTRPTYDFDIENVLTYITLFSIIIIYLISIFILAKNDIASLKIDRSNRIRIILGSVFFYGLNFFICYIVFTILFIGIGGLF